MLGLFVSWQSQLFMLLQASRWLPSEPGNQKHLDTMARQFRHSQRSNDPFSSQPLPKSFYHPSPTKEVNEREVIRSPQKHNNLATKCAEADEFLRGSPTYCTSALPNVTTLHDIEKPKSDVLKQRDAGGNSYAGETWPDLENSTSISEDSEAESQKMDAGDDVRHSELNRPELKHQELRYGELKRREPKHQDLKDQELKPHYSLTDGMDKKTFDRVPAVDSGESVLRRYVERFRRSEPKSREERMKESSSEGQFWWLQSTSTLDSRTAGTDANRNKGGDLSRDQHVPGPRPGLQELTKEALLAMDEETFNLQKKADRLLSRSELSLTLSSPVVSTEGLGSSTSMSNSSMTDDQMPYRPAFLRMPESDNRSVAGSAIGKEEDSARLLHTSSRSPADDILARWRLRRKVEEASTTVTGRQCGKLSDTRPAKNTELDVQVRLEEFRKKILSQKAIVTQQDILYERQRMSMLMDDVRQDGDAVKEGMQTSQSGPQTEQPAKDVILEKLQRITRRQDYNPNLAAPTQTMEPQLLLPSLSVAAGDGNFSINNANFAHGDLLKKVINPLTNPTLNTNNTALTDQKILSDNTTPAHCRAEAAVDSFGLQVIFDPNKKEFLLEQFRFQRDSSSSKKLGRDFVGESNKEMMEKVDSEGARQMLGTSKHQDRENKTRGAKDDNDDESKEIQTESSNESQQQLRDTTKSDSGSDVSKHDGNGVEKEHEHISISGRENFYQYLEAEKPMTDTGKVKVVKGCKTEIVKNNAACRRERTQERMTERQEVSVSVKTVKCNKDSDEEVGDEDKEQKKIKMRQKKQAKKEKVKKSEAMSRRDALVDITNEQASQDSCSKISGVKGHVSRVASQETKEVTVDSGMSSKQTRPAIVSAASPGRSVGQRASLLDQQLPVQHAIGQTIADHLFDGSMLTSSVDSWASAFPQTPNFSHAINRSSYSTTSPTLSAQRDGTLLESTPRQRVVSDQQVDSDEEYVSDGEFRADPLLQMLRQQREHYLQQLTSIEEKLQRWET